MNKEPSFLTKWFYGLFKKKEINREALIEIVRKAEQQKLLDHDASIMIEGALHISEMQVRDIMVQRIKMTMIKEDAKPQDILPIVVKTGYSRFPVIDSSTDEITGILLAKDLLNYFAGTSENFDIKDIMRPAMFIPESKRLNVLLREFRISRNHMAIVINEFSESAGLITIEDVLEEVVGEIEDEHDFYKEEKNIKEHAQNRFIVKAMTSIDDFNNYFNTSIQDDKYDTIGGLIISAFGYLPKRGETIVYQGYNVKILRADKRRIHVLLFNKTPKNIHIEKI